MDTPAKNKPAPESWNTNVIEELLNTKDKTTLKTRVPSTTAEVQLILLQFITTVKVAGMFFRHLKVQVMGENSRDLLFHLQVISEIHINHEALL